jgi:metallothionein
MFTFCALRSPTAQEGFPMADTQKCAHPACNCMVQKGEKYCSTYCHDAAKTVELICNCPHPGCADMMAKGA